MASSSFLHSQINPSPNHPSICPFLPSPSRPPPTLFGPGVSEANFHAWLSHRIALCVYVCVHEKESHVSQQPHTSHVVGDLMTYLYSSPLALPFTSDHSV